MGVANVLVVPYNAVARCNIFEFAVVANRCVWANGAILYGHVVANDAWGYQFGVMYGSSLVNDCTADVVEPVFVL